MTLSQNNIEKQEEGEILRSSTTENGDNNEHTMLTDTSSSLVNDHTTDKDHELLNEIEDNENRILSVVPQEEEQNSTNPSLNPSRRQSVVNEPQEHKDEIELSSVKTIQPLLEEDNEKLHAENNLTDEKFRTRRNKYHYHLLIRIIATIIYIRLLNNLTKILFFILPSILMIHLLLNMLHYHQQRIHKMIYLSHRIMNRNHQSMKQFIRPFLRSHLTNRSNPPNYLHQN